MAYAAETIAPRLKKAREQKGLSQRALSAKTGIPQAKISKIENGVIDLRLSTLIELARNLDLDLMLVPRKSVPAVQAIIGSDAGGGSSQPDQIKPAYSLDDDEERDDV